MLALVMGMVSFLTPCVLPLVPAYISFISGHSVAELRSEQKSAGVTASVLVASVFFVLGFSVVFILLGAAAGGLGHILVRLKPVLIRVAGALIIFFGLQLSGVLKFMPLLKERRFQGEIKSAGPIKAFIFGLAFAFGWSPCLGPILGSILALAANQATMFYGIGLLAAYSIGLAIPFLLTAFLIDYFFKFSSRVKPYSQAIEIAAGVILIAVGVLMMINRFEVLKYYLLKVLPKSISRLG